jgi:hypothetical protein
MWLTLDLLIRHDNSDELRTDNRSGTQPKVPQLRAFSIKFQFQLAHTVTLTRYLFLCEPLGAEPRHSSATSAKRPHHPDRLHDIAWANNRTSTHNINVD